MRVLPDTGPLVALLNRRDAYHGWSVEESDKLTPPFFSCEAVISEAHFLLQDVYRGREQLILLVDTGRIDLSFSYAAEKERVGTLMLQYKNVPMSFADACLVAMAELRESAVFTIDSDFRIYRKGRDQPLEIIAPW